MVIFSASHQSISSNKPLQALGGGIRRLRLFYIRNNNNNIRLSRPQLPLFYIPVLSNNNDDDSNGFNNNDFINDDSNGFKDNDFIDRLFCSINNDFIG